MNVVAHHKSSHSLIYIYSPKYSMNTGVRSTKEMLVWEKTRRVFTVENCENTGRNKTLHFSLVLVSWQKVLGPFISLYCVKLNLQVAVLLSLKSSAFDTSFHPHSTTLPGQC